MLDYIIAEIFKALQIFKNSTYITKLWHERKIPPQVANAVVIKNQLEVKSVEMQKSQ